MTFNVVVEKRAIKDIQQAVDYYDEKSTKAGDNFLTEVKTFLYALETMPNYQIRYDDIHCLPLKKFPFLIHFSIQEKSVLVHAITHTSSNPNKWPKR